MTGTEAVTLLVERFPILKQRVDDPQDLFETPHVTYGLLATEALENVQDQHLFKALCRFIDELANSGDDLLEELLVIDVLEGIAQDPDLAGKSGFVRKPQSTEVSDESREGVLRKVAIGCGARHQRPQSPVSRGVSGAAPPRRWPLA